VERAAIDMGRFFSITGVSNEMWRISQEIFGDESDRIIEARQTQRAQIPSHGWPAINNQRVIAH
jgi:hypothetical protein